MSEIVAYWWSRFGNFAPGVGIYPHMGQVITEYRIRRGFQTQKALAIALGYSERTIQELEGSMNLDAPDSIERRMVLARLLQIPPCLLALDWRFMVYKNNTVDQESPFADMVGLIEEDTYEFYDDLLAVGWESTYKGGSPQTATRITKRLHKLEKLAERTPSTEREAWLSLLCRYYQLSTRFARDRIDTSVALSHSQKAIDLANTLKDVELIAASHFRRIRVYMDLYEFVKKLPEGERSQQAMQYLDLARFDVNKALEYVEHVRNPLKSNIYLIAAEVNSLYAQDNRRLQDQCDTWQKKVANMVYREKGQYEDDGTFLMMNITAVHHERAKTLMKFASRKGALKEARSELNTAWKTLTPDLTIWRVNLHITEAQLNLLERDIEGSAQAGHEAYKIASVMQTRNEVEKVKNLYLNLQSIAPNNGYVCNLGLQLNMI
ncbi:MAG TPA: helix-turn-helix transcriptional regulator [Ktedonobacteraceae bacterium]|nr:helix-turn-helix transcriptional regulator [Ktedonobacteraceae bacterium]